MTEAIWNELSSVTFTSEYGVWVAPSHAEVPGDNGTARCSQHDLVQATEHCRDCDSAMCGECTIRVRAMGAFCKGCALVRGGIKPGRRRSRARRHPRL